MLSRWNVYQEDWTDVAATAKFNELASHRESKKGVANSVGKLALQQQLTVNMSIDRPDGRYYIPL